MRLALSLGEFHWEAKDIHNRWLEVLCQEQVQYYDNCAKEGTETLEAVQTEIQSLL